MAVNVVLKSVWDDKGVKAALNEFQSFGKGVGVAFAAVTAATAAAATALIKFGSDSIAAAENVAQANNRLEQVNKSMNLFGSQTSAVTQRIIEFAEANELSLAVDAEVIKQAQAKLLTFKNLAQTADETGGAFDRATMAAIDLAAAGFGSAETNATQLGKALQDPIKGLTALTRSGVTFTAEERNKIKVMVESGQVLEAQNMILSAIETQVGGTAEATAKASDRMKLAFDNISEAVGAALLPVFNEFANEITKITPEIEQALAPAAAEIATIFREEVLPAVQNFTRWLASPEGTQTLRDLTIAIIDGIKALIDFIGWVVQNREAIVNFTAVIAGLVVTYKAVTIATGLWQASMVLLQKQVVTTTATTTAFGAALRLLPWALAITGATLLIGSLGDYSKAIYGSKINTEGMTEAQRQNALQVENTRRLLSQYEYALRNSTAANRQLADEGVKRVRDELARLELQLKTTSGEVNRFNNLKLNNVQDQFKDTFGEVNKFNNLLKQTQSITQGLNKISIGGVTRGGATTKPSPTPTTGSTKPVPVEVVPETGPSSSTVLPDGRTVGQARAESDATIFAMKQLGLVGNQLNDLLFDQQTFFNAQTNLQMVVDKVLSDAQRAAIEAQGFVLQAVPKIEKDVVDAVVAAAETQFNAEIARPSNTININVKVDPTQSPAMVGKQLGTTINKYIQTGGALLVAE